MNLSQIESAIAHLPNHELAELMRWMGQYVAAQIDHDAWDNKVAADSANGKLDTFLRDAHEQAKSAKTTDL